MHSGQTLKRHCVTGIKAEVNHGACDGLTHCWINAGKRLRRGPSINSTLRQRFLFSGIALRSVGGGRVVVSTAAFRARVRGSVPGLGGLKETKNVSSPSTCESIVGSLRDREVACSASDRQGSNFESCVWRTVSSQSSHHPQEVLLAQFSLYVHKGGLKPDSFHFITVCNSDNDDTAEIECLNQRYMAPKLSFFVKCIIQSESDRWITDALPEHTIYSRASVAEGCPTLSHSWANVYCLQVFRWVIPANTMHWTNVGLMIDQRPTSNQHWDNICFCWFTLSDSRQACISHPRKVTNMACGSHKSILKITTVQFIHR